jgi:hypothetical protein
MFLLPAAGCARHNDGINPFQASKPSPQYASPSGEVVAYKADTKRYHRDANGQLYYVDDQGALHTVANREIITTNTGNTDVYYIQGDQRPYYPDDAGRLYYRDAEGRLYYLDNTGPGRVIDPLPILRDSEMRPAIESGKSQSFCNSEWKKCSAKCNDISRQKDRKACLDNCRMNKNDCVTEY